MKAELGEKLFPSLPLSIQKLLKAAKGFFCIILTANKQSVEGDTYDHANALLCQSFLLDLAFSVGPCLNHSCLWWLRIDLFFPDSSISSSFNVWDQVFFCSQYGFISFCFFNGL